jgi:MSHA biogenesis protein MshN
MSVINKMLRDLDNRQAASGATDAPATTDGLRQQGVVSVLPRPRHAIRWGWWLLLLLVVGMAAAGWWQWQQMEHMQPAPSPAPVAVVAPAMVVPAPAEVVIAAPAQEVVVEAPLPVASSPLSPPELRMDSTLSLSPARTTEPASAAPPKVAVPSLPVKVEPSAPAMAVAETPKKQPPAVSVPAQPVTNPASTAPAADAAGLAQRQQQAARETLAQAQALWNSGARDNAIALLHDAVAAAERAAQTNASPGNSQTLVPMLRELGRMELAEGRASAVWDLLTRLEPLIANQPELWALRANAAQRLGRHQDSVQAYNAALQSRPNEQRWLLGAAVSLAALGQTIAAGEMADKARAVGPVSKEVQTYLRQQGVPLADR